MCQGFSHFQVFFASFGIGHIATTSIRAKKTYLHLSPLIAIKALLGGTFVDEKFFPHSHLWILVNMLKLPLLTTQGSQSLESV